MLVVTGGWNAGAALAAPAKPAARPDTTRDDSGFKVRVVEESKGRRVPRPPVPRDESAVPEAAPTPPDIPDSPDVPEPPDEDLDSNDLVRFGEDITIPPGKIVDGNVVAMGGDVTVSAA